MKTNHFILRSLGKLLVVWMTVVLGMTNGWAVMLSPTSAQLAVTPSPAMAGQTVTLTMTVSGTNPAAPPTGLVTFKEGLNAVLGSVSLTNGVATVNTQFGTSGIHGFTATYAGDSNNGGTSMTTWFTVTAAATTTQLVPSANPARPNQAVTLTATVTGANPSGTVTFRNGNTILGTALLTAGTATLTQTFSTVGTYTLTASYSGDTNNQASASSPLTLAVSIEPQAYYIHTDHLDTPRTITDTNGTVVWQWDNIDPFGANIPNENPNGAGPFTFNLRFAGQYFDRETGLNYNFYRDCYDPALGRYCQSDPMGLAAGVNVYAFVNSNPLSYVDPLGLDSYLVGRLLNSFLGSLGLSHLFVVTDAKYLGDPNANVFSFGQMTQGGAGPVNDSTKGLSAGTSRQDKAFWNNISSNSCPADSPHASYIHAPDQTVRDTVNSLIPSGIYAVGTINSNSTASAIANQAAGTSVPLPTAGIYPGAPFNYAIRFRK